eukprot:Em0019g831a
MVTTIGRRRKAGLKQSSQGHREAVFVVFKGLPTRGHDEMEGNLRQLLLLTARDDRELQQWIDNGKYLSVDVINECVMLMGQHLLRKLLCDIHDAEVFAVLADETRDITNQEQLAICIRCVDAKFDIHEDLIGLVQLDSTTADSITKAIKDIFTRSLFISQCKGQGHDGASTMMGYLSGVATQLRKELRTNCDSSSQFCTAAHCLNLCLQDAAKFKNFSELRFSQDTLGIANEIEVTLLKAANCKDTNSAIGCEETLLEFYKKDIDGKKLVRQLIMLPDLVAEVRKTSPAFSSLNSVTNTKFLKIFLTIPVTTLSKTIGDHPGVAVGIDESKFGRNCGYIASYPDPVCFGV